MYRNIKEFSLTDKNIYLEMSKEFYSSNAVLHPISDDNLNMTFEACVTESPYTRGYIIYSEDIPAGYLLLSFTWSNEAGGICVLVEELYIRSDFQGKGLGSLVFDFLEDQYKFKAKRLRLEVAAENEGAINLYYRKGYEDIGYLQMIKENW